jgi:hypothetical protein
MSSFRSNIVAALVVGVLGAVATTPARVEQVAATGTITLMLTHANYCAVSFRLMKTEM